MFMRLNFSWGNYRSQSTCVAILSHQFGIGVEEVSFDLTSSTCCLIKSKFCCCNNALSGDNTRLLQFDHMVTVTINHLKRLQQTNILGPLLVKNIVGTSVESPLSGILCMDHICLC